ncbi:tRNA-methyltransferase subunit [Cavenderia fasciculata]|uniref:tRNA (adenine(58)-N(1))-methyltransferase non-catalytic subunit TRM6 n=1 Tax=Cavenderia fasciculata TaxID=261658 RepID=F4Q3H3_CACFS|nr:tRNA-methyltransferase subunit [Cavenderia fasciculata]EGG16842.1 tRNA-methyltransferase subunit [Cavenderia fasciculata]|eukprot:XP_004355316.1 tRNA-methyltransferase subunit [Cavenderia fasciculata]
MAEVDSSSTTTTTTTTSTTEQQNGLNRIKMGDTIILNINNGDNYKVVKLVQGLQSHVVGKCKKVDLLQLIGKPFYSTYQVLPNGTMERTNQKDIEKELTNLIQTTIDADNSKLTNLNTTQKLTEDDIAKMKQKGSSASEIIKALIENSDSFHTKTEYSQMKYLKKKMGRHSTVVKILKPTSKNLIESYYTKDPKKICNIRFDTLGQLLTLGNVKAGSNILVVDSSMGLVTGSVNERMNGDGVVLSAYLGKGPSLSIVQNFGFSPEVEQCIIPFDFSSINKLNLKEPESSKDLKAINYLKQGVDSLIIVSKYSPLSLILSCLPYLKPSGSFVIFSLYKQQLLECNQHLSTNKLAVNLTINEIWMREQQVLPKRTHPMMSMDGASGFLLSGIKVKSLTHDEKLNKQQEQQKPSAMKIDQAEIEEEEKDEKENEKGEEQPLKRKREDVDGDDDKQ